ncbi:snRNA-activating protein complex subunit 2 [Labrus mixtus]|uniref:snRNA-activating protein complex subunit 2 n=1 Tax=Labrus mixtus TaxID=508554 RepID=UPI0029BFDECD|nr:snRNA-activating protein complex subunit 2 [Labrus mixtus]
MKPPPRKRSKPERSAPPAPVKWQRPEHMKLLSGLKRQSRTTMGAGDLDPRDLKKSVKTRSVQEIQSEVDSLKDKVISSASFEFERRRRQERKVKKPIELWTDMASSVTGSLEETINTAFAQMLVVSSTEPRTLRNCDPPSIQRQTSDQSRPVGRTVPPRPIFRRTPLAGVCPPAPPLLVLKTPAPTMGPARRLPAPSKVFLVPLLQGEPSTKTGASAAPSCQTAATASPQPASKTPVTLVTAPVTPSSDSAAGGTITQKPSEQHISSPPSSAPSPAASPSISSLISAPATKPTPPPPSSPAAALPAGLGRSCRLKEDSPRIIGVKCVVDFERIYRYLSVILKPDEECHLTPMEGAIMLDLLMSLPEELPQLDCKELQKHLKQVYQSLSSPADSRTARDVLKDLQGQLSTPTESPAAPERDEPDTQQNLTDAQSEGVAPQPQDAESQSSESSNATSQQDADVTGVCPPLNPFMVPVKLLKCRKVPLQTAST